jgi:hypothetical protein
MPPTYAYYMLLVVYVLAGGAGLAVCLLLAVIPKTRAAAKSVAGGIVGSFPGVFAFQLLALPVVAVPWLLFWGSHQLTGGVSGTAGTVILVVVVALTFGIFGAASLSGFVVGWGIGSRLARGMSLNEAFKRSRLTSVLPAAWRVTRGSA